MKVVPKMMAVVIVLISMSLFFNSTTYGEDQEERTMIITEWQTKWGLNADLTTRDAEFEQKKGWIDGGSDQASPIRPQDSFSIWYKIQLPDMLWSNPSVYISKIYGQHVVIRTSSTILYESQRTYDNEVNKIIVPMKSSDSNKLLYIGVSTNKERIGIQNNLMIGNYSELLERFVKQDFLDVVLGSSFIILSCVILICSIFLIKEFISIWLSLAIVIFSIGILLLTYSSYLHTLLGEQGGIFDFAFDFALFVVLPSLTFFFEKMFGSGYRSIIKYFCRFQVGYSLICFLFMILNSVFADRYYENYYFVSVKILGYTIIVQCILLVITSVIFVIKGNKDALIFSIGFTLFASTAILELIYFYARLGNYNFFAWKWGVVAFIIALIMISGRRFAANHDQVVLYSRELELFNNELQHSEKVEIISELAASVAHEVRNPLQVTRGFLQLLTERYEQQQQREYLTMALEELDRASSIITDFLTFARPGFDRTTELDIREELKHIEGILLPLANLSGGEICVDVPSNLKIRGNSSKFKQALINLIKNSIEAWNGSGYIKIWAYQDSGDVIVHILDNGEGMDPEELSRLGGPYFSNKTKGTGLGLMVSFRIIEVMQGEIHYKSQKGVGTEAIITFPSIKE